MSVVVDNYDDATYTLVLNSQDKISGTNNNATFQVNWKDFLPEEFDRYKMIFTFQTTGGYYSDGVYPKSTSVSPPTWTGYFTPTANSMTQSIGALTPNPTTGQYITALNVPSGTTVASFTSTGNVLVMSQPTTCLVGSTQYFFWNATDYNAINYSSARVMFSTGSRSFSYDTSSKGPSTNLGVITRDLQTTNSKSNTLSCFYCQNPPRIISRPTANLVTITVFNNCVFQGGTGINGTTTTATNTNLLTDTTGSTSFLQQYGQATDMTAWTMAIEFIPIHDSKRKMFYES